MATQWFNYDGPNPAISSSYSPATGTPSCPGTPQQLCAIQAENDGNDHPTLDLNIALEMVQALQGLSNTSNVKLKSR